VRVNLKSGPEGNRATTQKQRATIVEQDLDASHWKNRATMGS